MIRSHRLDRFLHGRRPEDRRGCVRGRRLRLLARVARRARRARSHAPTLLGREPEVAGRPVRPREQAPALGHASRSSPCSSKTAIASAIVTAASSRQFSCSPVRSRTSSRTRDAFAPTPGAPAVSSAPSIWPRPGPPRPRRSGRAGRMPPRGPAAAERRDCPRGAARRRGREVRGRRHVVRAKARSPAAASRPEASARRAPVSVERAELRKVGVRLLEVVPEISRARRARAVDARPTPRTARGGRARALEEPLYAASRMRT